MTKVFHIDEIDLEMTNEEALWLAEAVEELHHKSATEIQDRTNQNGITAYLWATLERLCELNKK